MAPYKSPKPASTKKKVRFMGDAPLSANKDQSMKQTKLPFRPSSQEQPVRHVRFAEDVDVISIADDEAEHVPAEAPQLPQKLSPEQDEEPGELLRKKAAPRKKRIPKKYCHCRGPDDGRAMLQCARESECKFEWIHAQCVGYPEDDGWMCEACKRIVDEQKGAGVSGSLTAQDLQALFPLKDAPRGPAGDIYGLSSRRQETKKPDIAGYEYGEKGVKK